MNELKKRLTRLPVVPGSPLSSVLSELAVSQTKLLFVTTVIFLLDNR